MSEDIIRNKIFDAAQRIFVKKGKCETTLEEIAIEAHVKTQIVGRYYDTKEVLFQQVFKRTLEGMIQSVFLINSHPLTFKDLLRVYIHKHMQFLTQHQDIVQFLTWETRNNQELVKITLTEIIHNRGYSFLDIYRVKLKNAVKNGEIKDIDPFHFLVNLISLNFYFFIGKPLILSMFNIEDKEVPVLMKKREDEVFRLLWDDIKIQKIS